MSPGRVVAFRPGPRERRAAPRARHALRRGIGGVAAILWLAGSPGAVPGSELPPQARRLEAELRKVEGLRARFVQIREVALTGESLSARGLLAFRPPSRFRLAYAAPDSQELVIQGDSLWVIMPSEHQAQVYPFEAQAPGSEVFLLFGGQDRSIAETFDIVEEPWGSYPAALRLTPRNMDPGYPLEEIRLVVGKSGLPERLFFREATGDHVVFHFTALETNPSGLERDLALRLPPGMEIIRVRPPRQDLPIDPR